MSFPFLSSLRIDITERKLAEEIVSKAEAELTQVTGVMTAGELIASIAHEIN
jgi:phosphoglycerate-specific signal transduction histidine kinase